MEKVLVGNFLGQYRLSLDPSFAMDRYILENASWEQHVVDMLRFFVKPGFTCVDVGANAGYHTILMAAAGGADGHVYAFEPNPPVFSKLNENLGLNGELVDRVRCEMMGLGREPSQLKVFQAGDQPGNAYVSAEYNSQLWNGGSPNDFVTCEIVRLDTYMGARSVDLMKIDVEGMELDVLHGAEEILRRDKPTILYETLIECFDKEKIRDTETLLRKHGYLLFGTRVDVNKMVPTTFPYFQEDTVAIHRTKVVEAAAIMLSAARYRSTSPYGWSDGSRPEDITLVGDEKANLYIKITRADGRELSWDTVPFNTETSSVTCSERARGLNYSIEFRGDPPKEIYIRGEGSQSCIQRAECIGGRLILRQPSGN